MLWSINQEIMLLVFYQDSTKMLPMVGEVGTYYNHSYHICWTCHVACCFGSCHCKGCGIQRSDDPSHHQMNSLWSSMFIGQSWYMVAWVHMDDRDMDELKWFASVRNHWPIALFLGHPTPFAIRRAQWRSTLSGLPPGIDRASKRGPYLEPQRIGGKLTLRRLMDWM